MQYVDALSDIMLNVEGTVDLNGHREIIFLGPDENSADLMEAAALFMKKKGYEFWKSFTTGKPPTIGGIPHDTYGMTTRSVRAYVKGI
jgi:glutamate dehydrogenase